MSTDEKLGKRGVIYSQCNMMIDCFNYCNIFDLSAAGSKYTWWIKRDGQEFIRERLDGAVVNEAWCDIFPYTQVVNLPRIHSNHHPLLVKRSNISPDRQASKNFRFENAWLSHPSFADIIKQN